MHKIIKKKISEQKLWTDWSNWNDYLQDFIFTINYDLIWMCVCSRLIWIYMYSNLSDA